MPRTIPSRAPDTVSPLTLKSTFSLRPERAPALDAKIQRQPAAALGCSLTRAIPARIAYVPPDA